MNRPARIVVCWTVVALAAEAFAFGTTSPNTGTASVKVFSWQFNRTERERQAERSDHLSEGPLTDQLNLVTDLLPSTIAGDQIPNCDD